MKTKRTIRGDLEKLHIMHLTISDLRTRANEAGWDFLGERLGTCGAAIDTITRDILFEQYVEGNLKFVDDESA